MLKPIRSMAGRVALGALAWAAAAGTGQAAVLNDGGFETQGAAMGGSDYCYFGAVMGGRPACASGAWTGNTSAGLQLETNLPWPGQLTPDGRYYGFVQNLGVLSQVFSVGSTGTYAIDWLEAARGATANWNGNESYRVTLTDLGTAASSTLFSNTTTSGALWTGRSTSAVLTAGTSYRLSFQGTTATGDSTAFIDAVTISAVPEPATWAMMMVGFGVAAIALRRRPALRQVAA